MAERTRCVRCSLSLAENRRPFHSIELNDASVYYIQFMSAQTILICIVAWLIPGGGHLMLQKWKRGLTFLIVVVVLFVLGLYMQGRLFSLAPGFFGILKFVAGASTGLLYMVGKGLGLGQGDITSFGYEYGNTYLYTAGLINLLLVVDAFDIAKGRKQ